MPAQTDFRRTDRSARRFLLGGLALICSVLPPALCTLIYFPLWRARGVAAQISGFVALLLVFSALPLLRALKRFLASPSVWALWLFAFIAFRLLAAIAGEMSVIAFVGFLGNLAGAGLWRLAGRGAGGGDRP